MNPSTKDFLDRFLTTAPGRSPKDLKNRLQHWIELANNPEIFAEDKSPSGIAELRRKARQNVLRLAERHPEIAAAMMTEAAQ